LKKIDTPQLDVVKRNLQSRGKPYHVYPGHVKTTTT